MFTYIYFTKILGIYRYKHNMILYEILFVQ